MVKVSLECQDDGWAREKERVPAVHVNGYLQYRLTNIYGVTVNFGCLYTLREGV